ncbi:hypothetical protein EDB84DRAFT_1440760 [Lactarius hengduanensis]|nr:hypothetical protein EDB84DRAFT_1440760 [Lactarius hengduanensis]
MPNPTPEALTPVPPLSITSPPVAVAHQHNAEPLAPYDTLNIPSSASCNPDILPTSTEPHSSMIVTTAPSTSPGPTSAPDVGAAAQDDGRPHLGLRKEKDALGALEVDQAIHANSMADLDSPPSPSMRSITKPEVAIAGPSPREPDADHPPHTSHDQYDVV